MPVDEVVAQAQVVEAEVDLEEVHDDKQAACVVVVIWCRWS